MRWKWTRKCSEGGLCCGKGITYKFLNLENVLNYQGVVVKNEKSNMINVGLWRNSSNWQRVRDSNPR